jgi:CxxH/CxxC protein (TIGR04129 family)
MWISFGQTIYKISTSFFVEVWGILKEGNNMIYCCEEHVDLAIDTVVDEFETFPTLLKVEGNELSTTCEYCRNDAIYMVGNK